MRMEDLERKSLLIVVSWERFHILVYHMCVSKELFKSFFFFTSLYGNYSQLLLQKFLQRLLRRPLSLFPPGL